MATLNGLTGNQNDPIKQAKAAKSQAELLARAKADQAKDPTLNTLSTQEIRALVIEKSNQNIDDVLGTIQSLPASEKQKFIAFDQENNLPTQTVADIQAAYGSFKVDEAKKSGKLDIIKKLLVKPDGQKLNSKEEEKLALTQKDPEAVAILQYLADAKIRQNQIYAQNTKKIQDNYGQEDGELKSLQDSNAQLAAKTSSLGNYDEDSGDDSGGMALGGDTNTALV